MSHRDTREPEDTTQRNQATEAKEVDAMYELERRSKEERELERLFAADLESGELPAPPADLADRIKAEIPADLGWRRTGGADEAGAGGGVVVPFWRSPKALALAATLLLTASLAILMRNQLTPATTSPETVDAGTPTIDGGLPPAPASSDGFAEDAATRGDADDVAGSEVRSELETRRDELRDRLEGVDVPTENAPTDPKEAPQELTPADREGSYMLRRLPAPAPAPPPGEPQPESAGVEVESLEMATLDAPSPAELQGLVGGTVAPPVKPEPPPAPPAARVPVPAAAAPPAPRASKAREEEALKKLGYAQDSGGRREPQQVVITGESGDGRRYRLQAEEDSQTREASRQAQVEHRAPNDEAYDAMYFQSAGVNPFVDTEDDALSTFGLDVDTASYTVVRRYLDGGNLPPTDAVRVEEMLNFFDYGDAPPASRSRDDFALHAEVAPSRWAPDANRSERYYLVRFGLRARDVLAAERPPALLTFVVDVSGSMSREDRLGLVKQSLGLLLEHLRADDRVALVVYGTRGRVLIEPTSDKAAMRRAIQQLVPEGSTNAAEGLSLGYELTARNRKPGHIHRVILCSDGVANVGTTTSGEGILDAIEAWGKQGVELTTVGFGMGNYNDVLMETLADKGNGRYAYVDTLDEARRLFVDDLTGTLTTVAAEARAQVAFDPEVVARYRLLGYENRDIADERFRDDTVDAGEIGAGHAMTALYEVKTHQPLGERDHLATLTLRYASIARGEMVEQSRQVTGKDAARAFRQAPPALRLAATVAEFAEVLRGSYWARGVDLDEVFDEARKVAADWQGDADQATELLEFAALVAKANRLQDDAER